MQIVIAGGTGFLGTRLGAALRGDGHTVAALTRQPRRDGDVAWAPDRGEAPLDLIAGCDAVVNLAGESIAGARWTRARKTAIRASRVTATRVLADAIVRAARPPTFVSSSAIGIYGSRGDDPLTEDSPTGSDFLAAVCREWEDEARAAAARTRLVLLRTGLVLSRSGGALPQLALPFRLLIGGPVGSGRQYVSWIHVDDWVAMVRWAIATAAVSGPLNVTAPNPVTNGEMARALGKVLRRPAAVRAPAFAVRLGLGEMGDALILSGQRVMPARARTLGFEFTHPT